MLTYIRLGVIVALLAGLWIYKGRTDADHYNGIIAGMQRDAAVMKASLEAKASAKDDIAAAAEKNNQYKYQNDLAVLARDRDAARATNKQLLDTIALLGPSPGPSSSNAPTVPVSDADLRASRLAVVAETLDGSGKQDADNLGTCAAKLAAAESWAATVIERVTAP